MRLDRSQHAPELLRGSTDCLLLSLIRERPRYGYQLIREMRERSGGYFRFKEGTLYPALHRLEADGLIEGSWEQLPNGQERRYYRISPRGETVLLDKIAAWRDFANAVDLVFRPAGA